MRTVLAICALSALATFVAMPASAATYGEEAGDGEPGIQACLGEGNKVPAVFYNLQGQIAAREWAQDGACNGNGVYRGVVADTLVDTKCALVKFRDAGVVSTQGTDCSADDGGREYAFWDRNGDHRTEFKLCIEGLCDNVGWAPIYGY